MTEMNKGPRVRVRLGPGESITAALHKAIPRGRIERRRQVESLFSQTAHMVRLKPGRYPGASWIDNFVARRRNVNLCRDCDRRYLGWDKRYGYHPQREILKLSDCDGCGSSMIGTVGFYPEERYEASKVEWRYPIIGGGS